MNSSSSANATCSQSNAEDGESDHDEQILIFNRLEARDVHASPCHRVFGEMNLLVSTTALPTNLKGPDSALGQLQEQGFRGLGFKGFGQVLTNVSP